MLQKFKHTLAASCNIKIFKRIKRCLFSSILKYCSYFQASFEKQNYEVSELSSWLKKKFPISFLCVFLLYGHLCWNAMVVSVIFTVSTEKVPLGYFQLYSVSAVSVTLDYWFLGCLICCILKLCIGIHEAIHFTCGKTIILLPIYRNLRQLIQDRNSYLLYWIIELNGFFWSDWRSFSSCPVLKNAQNFVRFDHKKMLKNSSELIPVKDIIFIF